MKTKDQHPENSDENELVDIEAVLEQISLARPLPSNKSVAEQAEDAAEKIARHFLPEQLETVGIALILGAGVASAVCHSNGGGIGVDLVNRLLQVTGWRLVNQARQCEATGRP
ncbi:hypothetical protein [Amycolatopsis sp. NPDC059021]|uniref:hypothetical protein n=1 Tax=Amycolatopsis sp. NPDC059021 TaxID=3346704 RepID=UPI0036707C9C